MGFRNGALDIFYSLDGEFRKESFRQSLTKVKRNITNGDGFGGYISVKSEETNIIKYLRSPEGIWEEHYFPSSVSHHKRIRDLSDQNKISILEEHLLNN